MVPAFSELKEYVFVYGTVIILHTVHTFSNVEHCTGLRYAMSLVYGLRPKAIRKPVKKIIDFSQNYCL
jgi:hypothetical protein